MSLSRYSTRAVSITKDGTVGIAVASALVAASVTWALKPVRSRKESIVPRPLLKGPHAAELELAVDLALEAGEHIIAHSDCKGTYAEEEIAKSVKEVDISMGNVVINAIRKRFPMHKIISSDSITEVPQLTKDPTWIIGPVDGTTNFDAGLPLTCISIGFCVDTKPVIGVVYAPMTNELYLGARGHGSYRNGVKIKERKDVKCLNDAVVNFEFGLGADAARSVKNIMKHGVKSTRCFGSGMLDFCYVATGRLDVVFAGTVVEGWKPWDYFAPYVICREAGCVMESLTDQKPRQELNLYGSAVLCCTSQELLEETRKVALSKKKKADSEKAVKQ